MRWVEYLFYLTLSNLLVVTPQLNLYYTDSVSTSEKENQLQHDCLRTPFFVSDDTVSYEMISYCMSELSSKFHIEAFDFDGKLNFKDLAKENISSQQLFNWSAPIDLIEDYQQYLNENNTLLANKMFYNCTWPRFGPQCQYEFYTHQPVRSSTYDIINHFYELFKYNPINVTCYEYLQCNHRHSPVCLHWTEICNGRIDCLDDGIDEEHCWQLEVNQCKDDEYRCINGQCIPKQFFSERFYSSDCLDGSDVRNTLSNYPQRISQPSFINEDFICNKPPTGSCWIKYQSLSLQLIYTNNDNNSIQEECWSASRCILKFPNYNRTVCNQLCAKNACINAILDTCPDVLYIPNNPVLFGHFYLVFKKTVEQYPTTGNIWLVYVCSTISYYNMFFDMVKLDNRSCFFYQNITYSSIYSNRIYSVQGYIDNLYKELGKYYLQYSYNSMICNRSSMYQCMNSSKCISIERLLDRNSDCPYMDDENIIAINNSDAGKQLDKTHYKCQLINKYISQSLRRDSQCDCNAMGISLCEEEHEYIFNSLKEISFQTICDGFVELLPDKENHTDETECQQWSCDNMYTHCDGVWNCLNGEDEIHCHLSISSRCSSNYYPCVSPDTNQLNCLPIEKLNDGKIDCLGATDEVSSCREKYASAQFDNFYCRNNTGKSCIMDLLLCDGRHDCDYGDDEQFCEKNQKIPLGKTICSMFYVSLQSDVEKFLCNQVALYYKSTAIGFRLDGMIQPIDNSKKNIALSTFEISTNEYYSYCQHGIHLRVWLNSQTNSTTDACLCPPSYYGSNCQYHNKRISLTIKFRAFSDSYRTPFAILISLIDNSDDRIVHSYEKITYSSISQCETKFNIYLLYATSWKNLSQQYQIHIDFYEKMSLHYRGSVLLPVHFPFLPVQRLAFLVDIPRINDKTQNSIQYRCVHGKPMQYSNNLDTDNSSFCQCNEGWSGRYCTIEFTCNCGLGSKCVGISANNRSICICPINKFGPRCLLTHTICQNKSICQHGGRCISSDEYLTSKRNFICICEKGFRGNECETPETNLIFSFDKNIILSQSIFIHFIEIRRAQVPANSTTFQTIYLNKDSISIYWSQRFHLVFIELDNLNYYLAVKQPIYNESKTISTTVSPSDRCPHIRELLNETILQWPLIRRIKYYHLPCRNPLLNLSCFYDDDQLCLCYEFERQHLANCFTFIHNMTFDCFGKSECEYGARCLQNHPDCPSRSICKCEPCFYGVRCQFKTSGFGLSLDAIIGYHILPDQSLNYQPFIIKMSFAFTIIFVLAGLVDSTLSIMTFKNKVVLEVGCGLYLLTSSITTLLTVIMFALKFFILLLAQMTIIMNRSFLLFQCHSIDFLLRIGLHMSQWLIACVAIERAYTTIKGAGFNKKKSQQTAKVVIIILLITITCTCIHDPISRDLIDEQNNDDDMQRTWCIIKYGSILQVYNSLLDGIHFFGPFFSNLVSSIILITRRSHQQANIQKKRSYKQILIEQIRENKHLLTAPIVLVILAIPRLIIAFASNCLKSSGDVWLFLIGYFISFIPLVLTFIVFVLSSKFYKEQFHKSLTQLQMFIQRRLNLI